MCRLIGFCEHGNETSGSIQEVTSKSANFLPTFPEIQNNDFTYLNSSVLTFVSNPQNPNNKLV